MKAALSLTLGMLLLGSALAVECPGAADPSCDAFASLEILVTAGNCKGETGADCKAVSTSQSKFKEAYDEWWGEGGDACDGGKVDVAATAVATAIAEVWANAASKVSCDGRGFACGWSISGGNTYALGFAEALAQAAADAADGDLATAFCFADVRAVSTALAEAAAKTQSDACVTNTGTQEDFQQSYVQAVKVAIANAFASATARACNKGDEVIAASECKGDASATTEEEITKAGDACGGAAQLQSCTGSGATMCCDPNFKRAWCRCENCNGPWIRKSKANDPKRVFEDKKRNKCFCLDTKDEGVDNDKDDGQQVEEQTTTPENTPDTNEETTPETPETTEESAPEATEEMTGEATPETTEETTPEITEETTPETTEETIPEITKETTPETTEETIPETAPETTPETTEETTEETAPDTTEETTPETTEETTPETTTAPTVQCPGAAETSCNAFATLEILVTGGKCTGKAGASCEAVNESQSQFKDAYEEWWSEDGSSCDKGKAEAAAEAVAVAIANVWADAAVKVTCEGRGFACGWSASGGNTWAIAFAEALAQAAAEASDPHGQANAFCFSDVRAVSTVIADAAAAAQADVCTESGTKEDFQSSFAETIQIGIASAFAEATASACKTDGTVAADSKCVGDATSVTEGDTNVAGNACGGIAQLEACPAVVTDCCDRKYTKRLCNCGRKGCKNSPFIRKTDYNDAKNEKRSFEDRKKNVCFCLE